MYGHAQSHFGWGRAHLAVGLLLSYTTVSEASENHGTEAMDNSRPHSDSTSIKARQKRTDIKGALP